MVSSRRANRAVRSSIDLKKTMAVWHVLRWILVWVVCLCVCGWVGGGGDLDRLTNMQSCVPMEKKGNAFSFAGVVTNVLENNGRATGFFLKFFLPFVFLFKKNSAGRERPPSRYYIKKRPKQ
jgi:hypothetical protein